MRKERSSLLHYFGNQRIRQAGEAVHMVMMQIVGGGTDRRRGLEPWAWRQGGGWLGLAAGTCVTLKGIGRWVMGQLQSTMGRHCAGGPGPVYHSKNFQLFTAFSNYQTSSKLENAKGYLESFKNFQTLQGDG
jgi:hypothetical protein